VLSVRQCPVTAAAIEAVHALKHAAVFHTRHTCECGAECADLAMLRRHVAERCNLLRLVPMPAARCRPPSLPARAYTSRGFVLLGSLRRYTAITARGALVVDASCDSLLCVAVACCRFTARRRCISRVAWCAGALRIITCRFCGDRVTAGADADDAADRFRGLVSACVPSGPLRPPVQL
jgi:hypothetical protein